jgi:hypothetical protein
MQTFPFWVDEMRADNFYQGFSTLKRVYSADNLADAI